ncbi:MAG: diacylglycerol kinase family protein [Desulfococcaceae bacterium]|jgi:diacylglycerol kinase family enzyme|nr:diacylglycerol kinase family protein [Desulfococcaceae bacterium]
MRCAKDKKTAVIINKKAGIISKYRRGNPHMGISDALHSACPHAEIYFPEPGTMESTVGKIIRSGPDIIIAAGGDGTLNAIANQIVDTSIALGILPAGTFNLVANDLSIPLRMENALQAIIQGTVQRIDTGEMNGRIFLHHVSIGIHAYAVRLRNAYLEKTGISKISLTFFSMLASVLLAPRLSNLLLETGGKEIKLRAPFIFIGNNRFETSPFAFLRRKNFNEKCLNVFYTRCLTSASLLKMAAQTLLERDLKKVSHLESMCTEQLRIYRRKPYIRLIMDGEILKESIPLTCRIRPQSLCVVKPA